MYNNDIVSVENTSLEYINRNDKRYRVNINPRDGRRENYIDFPIKIDGVEDDVGARNKAIKCRDSLLILFRAKNSGYRGIRIFKKGENIYVNLDFRYKDIPYYSPLIIGEDLSYKEALKLQIKKLCKILNISEPDVLKYDQGLAIAIELGYEPHSDENTIVSSGKKLGDPVVDPKTGDVGVFINRFNDVSILGKFKTGEQYRIITDEVLSTNLLEEQVNVVEEYTTKAEDESTDEDVKKILLNKVEDVKDSMQDMYAQTNKNKDLPQKINEVKTILKRKKRVIHKKYGINIIKKKQIKE